MDIDCTDRKELRKFGLAVALVLCAVAGLHWWRSGHLQPRWLVAAAALAVPALVYPRLLAPVLWLWLRIAFCINFVVTHVILVLAYYLVITPTGLIMRAVGHDPMQRKRKPDDESYWEDLPDEEVTRERYLKQF